MQTVIDAARAIDLAEERPGIAVWQNNGIPANQTIAHVHFHVAGTLPEGGTNWGSVDELSVEETEKIASRLRPHLPPALT
jgi:histidine triad (HIT) family protein